MLLKVKRKKPGEATTSTERKKKDSIDILIDQKGDVKDERNRISVSA